jgi:hypothetical protein
MKFQVVENPARFNKFINHFNTRLDENLMNAYHLAYQDITTQLGDHLEGRPDKRKKGRPPGRLKDAIKNSENSMTSVGIDGNIKWIGIGHLQSLQDAPHWKYLEYGTYEQGEGEWPLGEPYRPGDSPLKNLTGDETLYKEFNKDLKGQPPNRAWRLALWNTKARVNSDIKELLVKPKRKRHK